MKEKEVKVYFILFLFVFFIVILSFSVSATLRTCNTCANCTAEIGNASAGDVINLTTSITGAVGTCISFNGKDNITFDCRNYTNYIQGDNAGGVVDYGIHLNSSQGSNDNIIKNCNITRFYTGVFLNNSLNNTLSNITSNFNNRSIDLYNSSNNRLFNITSVNNTGYGIYVRKGSYTLVFNGIIAAYNSGNGIYLDTSYGNNVTNVNSSFNLDSGVYLDYNNQTLLMNIVANNNSQKGVYLNYGDNNNNLSNIISNYNGNDGISIGFCNNNSLWNITAIRNSGNGIFLAGNDNNSIKNANFSYNLGTGIFSNTAKNSSIINVIASYNSQNGIYLNVPIGDNLKDITTNNNSQVGIYFGAGNNNALDNITANLNGLYGIMLGSDSNNLTNITTNFNTYGIVVGGNNNNLNNIALNSNNYSIYFSGAPTYNNLENLNIWDCSPICIYIGSSTNYNLFSKGKINFSSGELIKIEIGDYNNFSDLQLFESGLNDVNASTSFLSEYCQDNAVPAIDSCFDLSGSTGCGYLSSDCSWSANGYCEFVTGLSSCFDLTSSGVCTSFSSECSWNSNNYCEFANGLTDCSQIFDSTSCDSVSGCGWTGSCEGTISGGCSDILDSNNCEQGIDMNNCIWHSGTCKNYVGIGSPGYFEGVCSDISYSGDCVETSTLCDWDNGYCKQYYSEGSRGEGGFTGGCGDMGDSLTCETETNNLCYWLTNYDYSLGNTFLNCSYNTTKEIIGNGSQLIRKWYYRAYVNDTLGNALENFNVTSFNVSDSYQFNLTTDAIGFTTLTDIIDYTTNGTSKYYYSPYTISAENTSLSSSHPFNASLGNNYMDIFTLSLTNVPPNNPSPALSSADQSNTVNSNLNCYSQITDDNEDKLNASVRWYKNSVLNLTVNSNNDYASGTGFTSVLSSGNLSVGDSWKCSIRIYDGAVYSLWVDSSSLTIISPPSLGENQTIGETGGGGSSAKETSLWNLITPETGAIMEIKDSKLDIIRIIINVLENVYKASLNIAEINFSTESSREGLPPGQAYKAFKMEAKALNDTNIANVTIEFRVNRTWLEERNGTVSDVNLYRMPDNATEWSPLTTSFLNSDTTYHYFSSLSPGFSTFVVFFGKYECQPGIERCFNGQSQLCLGNATWLITEKCNYGCDEQGECITTAPQSVIIYTGIIALVSVAIILTLYLIVTRILKRRK
jgi:PGF-pre-PGF domain-containing protein